MHSLMILFDDEFGEALAERLSGATAVALRGRDAVYDSTGWQAARLRVLVCPRRDRHAEERMETVAWGTRRPWMPVQLGPRSIRVGPVIVPGMSACLSCFYRRQRQHGKRNGVDDGLERSLAETNSPGYRGHLPAHVDLVAGLLTAVAQSDASITAFATRFWRLGYGEMAVRESLLTPAAACPRCDPLARGDERYRHLLGESP